MTVTTSKDMALDPRTWLDPPDSGDSLVHIVRCTDSDCTGCHLDDLTLCGHRTDGEWVTACDIAEVCVVCMEIMRTLTGRGN